MNNRDWIDCVVIISNVVSGMGVFIAICIYFDQCRRERKKIKIIKKNLAIELINIKDNVNNALDIIKDKIREEKTKNTENNNTLIEKYDKTNNLLFFKINITTLKFYYEKLTSHDLLLTRNISDLIDATSEYNSIIIDIKENNSLESNLFLSEKKLEIELTCNYIKNKIHIINNSLH